MDLGSFIYKFLKGEITFRAWLISVLKANSFAYWDIKDPLPFFYSVCKHFISIAQACLRFSRTGKIVFQ